MKPALRVVPVIAAAMLLPACAHVKVDPIEVKEIHIVHDVNFHVDKELEEFFAYQNQPSPTTQAAPATQAVDAAGDVK
jgi:hypothetical protein